MRGLAKHGGLDKGGIPEDVFELALVFELSDSYRPGCRCSCGGWS